MRFNLKRLDTKNTLKYMDTINHAQKEKRFLEIKDHVCWVEPFGMLIFSSVLRRLERKDLVDLEIKDSERKNYAAHIGFFKASEIDIGKEPGEAPGSDSYMPIEKIDLSAIHREEIDNGNCIERGQTIEKKAKKLSKILAHGNEELQKVLAYSIREIIRNIDEHSGTDIAWICGQYWKNGYAEIAILDEGIGIKNSLIKNKFHKEYIKNDEDAIDYALKPGISKAFGPTQKNKSDDEWSNSGFGLYMVSEICKKLNGSFCLVTGGNYIIVDNFVERSITHFEGTAIKIRISTENLQDTDAMIKEIAREGELEAKEARNTFKKASKPSKSLML
jgi:hypothetical protein